MSYRYSDNIGDENDEVRLRWVHSETGPKNIAFLIGGKWIDVTPTNLFFESTNAWFMEWEFPENDDDETYLFSFSYAPDEPETWFYVGDDTLDLTKESEKSRAYINIAMIVEEKDN